MKRTLALAATSLVQSVIVFVTSTQCFAQDDGSKSLFMPSTASQTMESMTDGLLPLTFYIAFQVAVMTVLALVIAMLMRKPIRTAHAAANAMAG
jgi:hypothetical protein